MTVDARQVLLVRRSRSEVAAFMFDPANDPRWTSGINESRPQQPGPLVKGAIVVRTVSFLGRKFAYEYEVTSHEPDRFVELTVERPFPMTVRYELEDAPGGTLVAMQGVGSPNRFFGWATPMIRSHARKVILADLERLRACLEG